MSKKNNSTVLTWILSPFKILFVAVLFWIAAHVYALIGLFISVGYPILWLVTPRSLICLSCRLQSRGNVCPLCGQTVTAQTGIFPHTLPSLLANAGILFVLAILAIGLVNLEFAALKLWGYTGTPRTASFQTPSQNQHMLGEVFPLHLEVKDISTSINAVQIDLRFNPKFLQVVKVDKDQSFLNIFIQEEVNNNNGYVSIMGGIPNPGYSQQVGRVATIFFQTTMPGTTKVEFLPESMVLANDGKGSNILKASKSISYIILPTNPDALAKPVPTSDAQSESLNSESNNSSAPDPLATGPVLDFTQPDKAQDQPTVTAGSSDTKHQPTTAKNFLTNFLQNLSQIDKGIIAFLSNLLIWQ